MEGGFDNGGGPRKATPSKHGFGFKYSAPRKWVPRPKTLCDDCVIQMADSNGTWYLSSAACGTSPPSGAKNARCLVKTSNIAEATPFSFYDTSEASEESGGDRQVSARIAVTNNERSFLSFDANGTYPWLYSSGDGFWQVYPVKVGHPERGPPGLFRPSEAQPFTFTSSSQGSWRMADVAWQSQEDQARHWLFHGGEGSGPALASSPGQSIGVSFVERPGARMELIV